MCFTIKNNTEQLKTAPKDIICYKLGYKRWLWFISPHYDKIYGLLSFFFCEKVKIKIRRRLNCEHWIDEGYHSYKNTPIIQWLRNGKAYTYKFIIPRGTIYCENETEYVSERILRRSICPI